MSPRTIRNCLLTAGLRSRMPLARLLLAPHHHQARLLWCHERVNWRVKWHSVVFSDASRFVLYASDGHARVWHRPWVSSSRMHSLTTHRPHSRLHGVGSHQLNSRSDLVFLQGKVNSACYVAQVVNPMLLPFIRQEAMCLQQDNTCPHMAAAKQHALHDVQQLPWPARSPDLSPVGHIWDMMKQELNLS